MNRDKIVDWLDNQIQNKMIYECMPENETGYEYVPRHEVVKIVDALIPMIKGELKKCNIPDVSKRLLEMEEAGKESTSLIAHLKDQYGFNEPEQEAQDKIMEVFKYEGRW